jgi:hypothetical protein
MCACALHGRPSEDLAEGAVGEPEMDVVLEPGDMLYMPRGTVHTAVAQEAGSCHLRLSTYQRWSYAELAGHMMAAAAAGQQEPACLPLALRKGLPLGHIFACGLQVLGAVLPHYAAAAR